MRGVDELWSCIVDTIGSEYVIETCVGLDPTEQRHHQYCSTYCMQLEPSYHLVITIALHILDRELQVLVTRNHKSQLLSQ